MKTIRWKGFASVFAGIAIVAVVRGPSRGVFVFAALCSVYLVVRDLRHRKLRKQIGFQ